MASERTNQPAQSDGADPELPKSVTIAFKVLEAVAATPGVGVSALARQLEIPKSTVQRALRTLEALDYVYSGGEPTRWSLTLRAYSLGARAPAIDLGTAAQVEMKALSELTGESIQLTTLEGDCVVVIEKIDSTQPVRSYVARGERLPAHVSATGKALLAATPHVLDEILSRPLHQYTEESLIDPDEFRQEIARINRQGYALNRGEYRSDIVAVGAVIRGPYNEPLAGLGVSAPKHRVSTRQLFEMAPRLLDSVGRVAANLGGARMQAQPAHPPLHDE